MNLEAATTHSSKQTQGSSLSSHAHILTCSRVRCYRNSTLAYFLALLHCSKSLPAGFKLPGLALETSVVCTPIPSSAKRPRGRASPRCSTPLRHSIKQTFSALRYSSTRCRNENLGAIR